MNDKTSLQVLEGVQDDKIYKRNVLVSKRDSLVHGYLLRNAICITSNLIKSSNDGKKYDYVEEVFLVPEIASNIV